MKTQTTFKAEMERANALEQAGEIADAEQVRRMAYADFTEDGKPKGEAMPRTCHHLLPGESFPAQPSTLSEYEQQALSFLAKHGLKFRATLSNSKPANWEPSGNHYRVTLSKSYKTNNKGHTYPIPSRLTFDFWGSVSDAEKGKHPSAYDVLACISSDVHTPDTFEDFCAEYGYEQDSIKALQTFRRANAFARRLRAFFTGDELTDLAEIN